MFLICLEKLFAKHKQHGAFRRGCGAFFGHCLPRSVYRPLNEDLDEQENLRREQSTRLELPSFEKIQYLIKRIEKHGVPHLLAKEALLSNNYDYEKAILQLILLVLSKLEGQDRQWTALAVARLIEPADSILQMDQVLKVMLACPEQPWRGLGIVVDAEMQQRKQRAREDRKFWRACRRYEEMLRRSSGSAR